MAPNLIINFAPNGMIPTRATTPHVPLSISEVVEDVHAAYECGITMTHLHARNQKTGAPTCRAEIYGAMIAGIRRYAPDLVICTSLSGRNSPEFEKRAAPLQLDGTLKPDMGSLTLSSMNFMRQASVNDPDMVQRLASEMQRKGIMPELEAFDAGMVNYAHYLAQKQFISPPYYFNLLLGNVATAQAELLHAGLMIQDLPANSYWSLAGIGEKQLAMNSLACAMGGGVRTGLEDNIFYDVDRSRPAKNIELIERIHTLAEANCREVMKPTELRSLLQLEPGHGRYGRNTGPNVE